MLNGPGGLSWKILLYGTPTPTRARKVTTYCLFAFIMLAIYGMRARFLPAEWWSSVGLWVTHAATVIGTGLIWWGARVGVIPLERNLDRRRKVLGVIALPLLLWMALWAVLTRGVPDLLTRTTGSPGTISLTLRKEHSSSRRSCSTRVTGGRLMDRFPGYLCIPSASYAGLPDRGPMDLVGTQSLFGMHVSDVRAAATVR